MLCLSCGWSSPALQLLHGRTQVAGRHHVHLPLDAVFGDERVKRVWQHAEEQRGQIGAGQTADEFEKWTRRTRSAYWVASGTGSGPPSVKIY